MIARPIDKFAEWVLFTFSRVSWGVPAVVMPVIVQQAGGIGTLRWLLANIPKYERAIKEMGPISANLMFALASLLNGCAYCVFAHARAFELYYFEKYGKLFPLTDQEIINLIPLTDDVMREKLERALRQAGLAGEIETFHRLYALKLEGAEPTPADGHLMHAIRMYDFLNFCAIESQSALDDAHDRINKDTELKRRYAEARLDAGREKLLVEDLIAVEEHVRSEMGDDLPDGSDRT